MLDAWEVVLFNGYALDIITCYFKAPTVGQMKFLRNNQFEEELFFINFIAMSERQTFIHKIKGEL